MLSLLVWTMKFPPVDLVLYEMSWNFLSSWDKMIFARTIALNHILSFPREVPIFFMNVIPALQMHYETLVCVFHFLDEFLLLFLTECCTSTAVWMHIRLVPLLLPLLWLLPICHPWHSCLPFLLCISSMGSLFSNILVGHSNNIFWLCLHPILWRFAQMLPLLPVLVYHSFWGECSHECWVNLALEWGWLGSCHALLHSLLLGCF